MRLCRDMVEINDMTDGMQHREEKRSTSRDFVKLYVCIKWNILLYGELLQFGDKVSEIKIILYGYSIYEKSVSSIAAIPGHCE